MEASSPTMGGERERREAMPTHDREELLELRRQHHRLSEERQALLPVRDHLDPAVAFTFVEQEKANHAVALLCWVLGMTPLCVPTLSFALDGRAAEKHAMPGLQERRHIP